MAQWIPFDEGLYLTEQAFFCAAKGDAVVLEDAVVEIYLNPRGKKQLKGQGKLLTMGLVNLLEENDDVDLVLDFGHGYMFLLENPEIQGGKVFSPDVRSTVQFHPKSPWKQLSKDEFDQRIP